MAISSECWWEILHGDHHAWFQRSLMAGDFKPGLPPRSEYIVDEDGRVADPDVVPTCGTCGVVPRVEELEPVERITGVRGFLSQFRARLRPWPKPTNPATCWHCNCPGPVVAAGLCSSCIAHMEG